MHYNLSKEVKKVAEKTLAIRIDGELHRRIKIYLAKTDKSLKDYVVELIEKDLDKVEAKNAKKK